MRYYPLILLPLCLLYITYVYHPYVFVITPISIVNDGVSMEGVEVTSALLKFAFGSADILPPLKCATAESLSTIDVVVVRT